MQIGNIIEHAMVQDTKEAWEHALKKANEYKETHPDDPEAYYILGYVYFHWPERTLEQLERSEELFSLCLVQKRDHQLALYHLSLICFLSAKYVDALDLLERMRNDYFVTISQNWRVLKVEELRLSCKMLISRKVELGDLQEFVALYQHFPEPSEVPALVEICFSLNDLLGKELFNGWDIEALDTLCYLIGKVDQRRIFIDKIGPFYDYLRKYPEH